jgi:hypothetical protein
MSGRKYATELAVSVVATRLPSFFQERNMFDCLNYKLSHVSGHSTPIVMCEAYNKGTSTTRQFYVEVRSEALHKRLLLLDGTSLDIGNGRAIIDIERWDVPGESSPQKRNHLTEKFNTGNNGNDERPAKRAKQSSTSRAQADTGDKNLSIPTSPPNANNNKINRQIFLHTTPPRHTPESFLIVMNETLKNINMSDTESILDCYEAPTLFRDWVLEMKTEEAADQIMNISGRQMVEGTRLHFKRHANYSASPTSQKDDNSVQTKRTDATRHSSSASPGQKKPTWRSTSCLVYLSKKPCSLTVDKTTAYINRHFVDQNLFDHDIILRGKSIAGGVCVFLAISPDAAQSVVDNDKLGKIVFKNGVRFQFRRDRAFQVEPSNPTNATLSANDKKSPLSSSTSKSSDIASRFDNDIESNKSSNQMEASKNTLMQNQMTDVTRIVNDSRESTSGRSPRKEDKEDSDGEKINRKVFVRVDMICNSDRLAHFFNDQLEKYGYNSVSRKSILSCKQLKSCYVLEMATQQLALYLMNFNSIQMASKKVVLTQHRQYRGPQPRFQKYADFLKDHQTQESGRSAHASLPKTATTAKETATGTKNPAENEEITRLKDENEKLKRNMFTILKENKAKLNALVKTEKASGSLDQPIELDDSDDEKGTGSSQKFGKEEYNELQKIYEKVAAELEKSEAERHEKEKELDSTKKICNALESKVDVVKMELASAEEARGEIHQSWQDQFQEINQQKEIIDSLRSEQMNEIAKHQAELKTVTDSQTKAINMLDEERQSRRVLMDLYVNETKAHKKSKKEYKGIIKNAAAKVKAENDFDA